MMPEVSGMDVFERAGASDPDLRARFVMMTGGAFTPRAAEFFTTTTVARLEKPIGLAQLREAIDRILGRATS
jgi:DNA-binding NtrC family response regulator